MYKYYKMFISLVLLLTYFLNGNDIPINPAQKGDISNWLFLGPLKENTKEFELVGKIEKDPEIYFTSKDQNLEIKNIQSKIILGGQFYYQLYDNLNKGDILFAFSQIDSRSNQSVLLRTNSFQGNIETYINGNFVINTDNQLEETQVQLKKGLNHILLKIYPNSYNPNLTGLYHRFFLNILPASRFILMGKLLNKDGDAIPFEKVSAYDNSNNYNTITDENGFFKYNFYPVSEKYQLSASNNNLRAYSQVIIGKDSKETKVNLICNISAEISGNTYMLDKGSPNAGITIILEKLDSKDNFKKWNAISDENGKYTFSPNIGKYNISYYADGQKNYVLDLKGIRKVFDVKKESNIIENLTLSNQVKGSWKRLNLFDGMLSNGVYDLIIGSDGLLYIATFNGLSIYDGQSVVSYNYKQGLPNSQINQLFEDSDGNIWLGYEYFGAVKWKNGIIKILNFNDGLSGNSVRAINQDKDGNILFGTERGLSIYNGKSFTNLNYSDGLGNGGISAIEVDGKNIWLGGSAPAGGFSLYNGTALKNFDVPGSHQFGLSIKSIKKADDGKIWFTDSEKGLFCYDGQNFNNYTIMDGLPDNETNDIYIESNNKIWISTNSGVAFFNGKSFRTILELNDEDALEFASSSAVTKSKDGVFFFGQGNNGVIIYDPNSLRNITKSDGFKRSSISDIQFDNDNNLWYSSWWGQGLSQIQNEKIIKTITTNDGLPNNFVNEFDFTSDGTMWIATRGGAATYKNNQIQKVFKKEDGLPRDRIISLTIDENDNIWFYTLAGLTRYNGDSFTTYSEEDGLVRPRNNGDVSIDKKGNIIFTTYGSGLSIFNGKTFTNISKENGLVDDRIWDIGFDSKNNYWIATDGSGVQKYDGNNFSNYDIEDGISAGETFSIYVDDFDMVWVGTFSGGACLYDGEIWNCIDSRDGLVDNTISAIYGTNGNKLWFGSWQGLTTYIPKRESGDVYLKKVVTPKNIFSDGDLSSKEYSLVKGNRISFLLNSNSFNTLKEKQKYKLSIINGPHVKDTLITTNKFDYIGNDIGSYTLKFQSIDRDLNISKPSYVKFSIIGPWYINPSTAFPFWGFIVILISLSAYTFKKYLKQRKTSSDLKEESQRKDRKARMSLEEKNSELLESQKAAEAANAAKSTFLANMSHELRTPLNAIIGYSEMLIEDAEDENEDFIPDLDKINGSGKHLLGLINDILDLSKVESGKMELFIEEFELSKILKEIEATIKPLVEKNNNKLKVEIESGIKTIKADITKIRQIVLNLLSNSSKFTKDGDIIFSIIKSTSMENAYDFVVSDSGIGMSQEQVDKVFKPFTQADEKTTRKFGGTGLGLTITKMFAEMMGGEINLKSKEGKGTTFTVTIPKVVKELKEDTSKLTTTIDTENPYTILVIDDDDNAQDMMKKYLQKQSISILQAKSGEEGLKLALEHMPDAITLDVMMPEMDGWEVLSALQANDKIKNIPVIMLTMADEPDLGFSLGATDYLTKPVNWNQLSTILKKHQIQSNSESIMIVEDDEITRDMLRKSLESNNFKVKSAVNGKEALEKIKIAKPGLIILDLMMPEMDGFEFSEKLRENKDWLDIPVVVITAKDLTKEDHNRLKGNVEAIMQKGSYSKKELLAEVGERIKKLQTQG